MDAAEFFGKKPLTPAQREAKRTAAIEISKLKAGATPRLSKATKRILEEKEKRRARTTDPFRQALIRSRSWEKNVQRNRRYNTKRTNSPHGKSAAQDRKYLIDIIEDKDRLLELAFWKVDGDLKEQIRVSLRETRRRK